MSKVAKVLFPDGKLCVIKEVEAYCEQVVEIADKTIRLMEKAKDFCENPTALVFNVEERDDDIFMPMKSRKVEYSGRFYPACPVMETGDSGLKETVIPVSGNH